MDNSYKISENECIRKNNKLKELEKDNYIINDKFESIKNENTQLNVK